MIIGHGRGGIQSVPSIERGEVYNLDKFRPSFSLAAIGETNYLTIEAHQDFDIRFYSLTRSFFILSASGELSTSVEMFLSNSVGAGGFTIVPGTGTEFFGNNLNGAKINQGLNAVVKLNPTITNLPTTPNFILDIINLRKTTSGNSTSVNASDSQTFFSDKYVIIPAGVSVVLKANLINSSGTSFDLEYYTEIFLTESRK